MNEAEGIPLRGNTISQTSVIGLYLEGDDNLIYQNNFISNGKHVQVDKLNSNNHWDNGIRHGGNYWSDYRGFDLNGDRIGDTPYYIIKIIRLKDNFPLMEPF